MAYEQSVFVSAIRKSLQLNLGTGLLGALLTFFYLTVINPVPRGNAALAEVDSSNILFFAIAPLVGFGIHWAVLRLSLRLIENWYEKLQSGVPASELPISVARWKSVHSTRYPVSRTEAPSASLHFDRSPSVALARHTFAGADWCAARCS